MGCRNWNDEWVADLYDELDADERLRLHEHLAECTACRATLDGLAETRRELRENAGEVPLAPRVVLVPARAARPPVWAFAAGLAFALLLFAGGIFAGRQIQRVSGEPPAPSLTMADVQAALNAQRSEFDDRLAQMEASWKSGPDSLSAPVSVTRGEVDTELADLRRRIELDRARDFEFLLAEINATEARAGSWNNEIRQALQLVMLSGNPGITDR
jgi:hypothetical protein